MATNLRRVEYFYATVADQPGKSLELLRTLAELGVHLAAFTAIPIGPNHTQLTLFPEDPGHLKTEAKRSGLALDGPHPAFLVRGDDELGVLAQIHEKLYAADVNVYASSGVSDGAGHFGYVVYVRPELYAKAASALNV